MEIIHIFEIEEVNDAPSTNLAGQYIDRKGNILQKSRLGGIHPVSTSIEKMMRLLVRMRLYVGIFLMVLLCSSANAQRNRTTGNIIFKGKVFTAGFDSLKLVYVENVSIHIIMSSRGVEQKSIDVTERHGVFKEKLELNESYDIYISKQGYETKYFKFSTAGADPDSKYSFFAEVILKKEGEAYGYTEEYPVTHIAYDDSDDAFVLIDR